MKTSPTIFIAVRALLGRGDRKGNLKTARSLRKPTGGMAGAILSIGISVVPLILVLVVSDGMIQGITNRYIETKSFHIQVAAPDSLSGAEAEKAINNLTQIDGIRSISLERTGSAVAVSSSDSHAAFLRAPDSSFFNDPGTMVYLETVQGDIQPRGNKDIVLGSALAETLDVGLGDSITIITPDETSQKADPQRTLEGFGYSPKLSFFRVSGIVSAGYRDIDELWAFVTPQTGERLLNYPSSSTYFGIKTDNPYSNALGILTTAIDTRFQSLFPGWYDSYLMRTWPQIENGLYVSFGTTKSMLLVIMGIALLVAAVNLGSSLSTFVAEHSMDIAVLRSLGASDSFVRNIFVGAGLFTGSIGTFAGIVIGVVLSAAVNEIISIAEWVTNLLDAFISMCLGRTTIALKLLDPGYYLEKIPVIIDPMQIFGIFLLCVFLSAVVSLIPSRKAALISVQDLIRKS